MKQYDLIKISASLNVFDNFFNDFIFAICPDLKKCVELLVVSEFTWYQACCGYEFPMCGDYHLGKFFIAQW